MGITRKKWEGIGVLIRFLFSSNFWGVFALTIGIVYGSFRIILPHDLNISD